MVHSDHLCHMNLQCKMVVTGHNGSSYMLPEKGGLLSIHGLTWFHFLDTGCAAQGTCVTHVGVDEDMWWFTGDTAECLEGFLPLVEEHGFISGCVPAVGNGPYWWAVFVMNVTLLGVDI